MDIESQASTLRKKIEKIERKLTDGTALSASKIANLKVHKSQLKRQQATLQAQLPKAGVKKVVHQ